MKKLFLVVVVAVFSLALINLAYGADEAKTQAPASKPSRPMAPAIDKNIKFLAGTISAINTSDPTAMKIDVKNEMDEKTSTIEVSPRTNVLKVVDPADLKAGDKVRIMAKTTDNKDVAISIMTGNIKMPPVPTRPAPTKK